MAILPGSQTRVAFTPETMWGTTPASPAFKTVRRTGGNLRTNKSTATTNEIRADRNVSDLLHLGQDVAGSYDFELTYGGAFDDLLAAVMYGTWSTDVLKNGSVVSPFTVEETVGVGSGGEQYSRFNGCQLNTLALSITARQPITGSIGLMGRQELTGAAPVTGATYAAPATTPVSTASANVANLGLGGTFGSPKVRSLSLNVTNNLRTREVVGNLYSEQFGLGRFEVTGQAEVYFETNDAYQAALAHTGGALSFTVGNAAGQKYTITLPRYIFGDPQRNTGNNTSDVMATLPFTALYDQATACTMQIARNVT